MPYSTPIRANGKRSFALVSENQPAILPGSDETHVQMPAYLKELRPRQKRKLNNLKCSYCRRDKKPCSPANRVWPGQKCKNCEIKGLSCSEATQSRLGRPPNSQTSDHKLNLVVPQTVDDSSLGADAIDGQSDYVKLMNRISYGQMLAALLDTLEHLKTNLIEIFDKEMMFTDYWNEAPGLQDCREFEEFVKSYHRDNILRPFSSQNLQIPANPQAISSALLASALSTKFTPERDEYNDYDMKMLRAHVSVLSSSGFLGHAMTLQTALVTRASVYDTDNFDEEWNTLIMLKNRFQHVVLQILPDPAFSEGCQTKVPQTLINNPLPIPEELVLGLYKSWELLRFRYANWEIDCLGRTLEQIALGEDHYFCLEEYSLKGQQDIIGRSNFHVICEKNTPLKWLGGFFPRPADMEEIRQKNCTGQQLLHYAAVLGNVRTFKYLLSFSGIEADCPDVLGRAPVFYAASNGHTKILRLLLDQYFVNVDRKDNKGYTPLCIAAYNCQLNAIECLLEKGADANYVNLEPGLTPLAQAVLQQDIDVVRLLGSQKNIDVNGESKNEAPLRTPLAMAIANGFQEGVQYLLGREDIDFNKRGWNELTPLDLAVRYRAVDTVRLLAAHPKVNVNLASSRGGIALIEAAKSGSLEIVEILLTHPDIDINLADSSGYTPLITAAVSGRTEVILSLLRYSEVDLGGRIGWASQLWNMLEDIDMGKLWIYWRRKCRDVGLKCDEESESMSNKPNLTIFQAFSGLANSPIGF